MILLTFLVIMGFSSINMQLHLNSRKVNDDCIKSRNKLGDALSSFTNCSMLHSYPIMLCQDCVNEYIDILDRYENLTSHAPKEEPCINEFINLDRLEILRTLYENSYDLWNRAKCYECFQFKNGKLTNISSEETRHFNTLYQDLTNCVTNITEINDTNVCWMCMDEYLNVNDYYESISNENEKICMCMDIVDKMNTTRNFWSLRCSKFRHKDEKIFLVSTAIVICITILFYVCTKFCSKQTIPIILRQSRFVGSISQSQRDS